MKRVCSVFLIVALILSGCGTNSSDCGTGSAVSGSDGGDSAVAEVNVAQNESDMFTDRDYEVGYDEDKSVLIQLNGDAIACASDTVQVSGTTATITGDGTYILSGTLDDGMIVVDAGKKAKPQLVLNGVSINSETSAPIYILEADKVFLTLAADTSNTLSNGGTFTAIDENNIDAAIFSKEDLTLNGSGNLTVTSPAGHGIVSKDDLVFTSGTYTIQSASHGLDANDSVRIANATIGITSGKDGMHAENSDNAELGFVYILSGTFDISAEGDGISAGAYMQIRDGSFQIVSGGGSKNSSKEHSDSWGGFMGGRRQRSPEASSTASPDVSPAAGDTDAGDMVAREEEDSASIKGLKAAGDLQISGGTFVIDSADDSVHSNSSIVVNGGSFEIASGDDGFHADESLTVTDGTIHITESYEGLEALNLTVAGGDITIVATDDGLNAAGGKDSSGFDGQRKDDQFGGGGRGRGGFALGDRDNGDGIGNRDRGEKGGMGPGGGSGGTPGGEGGGDGTLVISGGNLYVQASGDGLDANGTLEITGGNITICGPTEGDTSTLDYDTSGVITGGTFIGTGASGMAQTFSSAEQGVISVNAGEKSADTEITLKDKSGNTILSHTPELPFAVVILSSPEIVKGETYTLTIGSSSKEFTAG